MEDGMGSLGGYDQDTYKHEIVKEKIKISLKCISELDVNSNTQRSGLGELLKV